VADFGLSRLKHETFLTTKTGKGTVSSSKFNLRCIKFDWFKALPCVIFCLTYLMWLSYPAAMDGARGVAQ